MLTVKDSAYVLLLGLGLWIADRAVQELRRVREELVQLRSAVQQQDERNLQAALEAALKADSFSALPTPKVAARWWF